jgi:hypothetical protein
MNGYPELPSLPPSENARRTNLVISRCFPICLFSLGFIVFFRNQLFSDFDLMFGDRGDARFIVFMHEHVYRWILGKSELLSPPFFFDQKDTLGYSESLLLDQIIYAPFRLIGLDSFLATNLVAPILSVLSFTSLYLLLRYLGTSSIMGTVPAFLYTFANNLFLKSIHPQHFVCYLVPVIALCTIFSLANLHRFPHRACTVAGVGALLFGLMFSTSFYIAWFFAFDLLIFIPVALYLSWPTPLEWWRKNPRYAIRLSIVTVSGLLPGLIVFAIIYGPIIIVGARRDFADYLIYAPNIFDAINVGRQNFVWGQLIAASGLLNDDRLTFTEVTVALTPILQGMTIASLAFALKSTFWSDARQRITRAIVIAAALVPFVFFVVTVKVGDVSLFKLLYAVVPGAGVIRAGYRGMVVADFFAVVSVSLCFDRIFRALRVHSKGCRSSLLISTALGLSMVEQLNLGRVADLSRASEYGHLAKVGNAPLECHSFYVLDEPQYHPYEVQLDAMLTALQQNIPTINGYSGIFPEGWDFYDTKSAIYEDRVLNWVVQRGVAAGLCRLDVIRGSWVNVANDQHLQCSIHKCAPAISLSPISEFRFDFKTGGNAELFTDKNWSVTESWGRWTSDRRAAISFILRERAAVQFTIVLRGLLSAQAPQQAVSIIANGCRVVNTTLDLDHAISQTVSGLIPETCIEPDGSVVVVIDTDRTTTPRDIGLNSDQRRLGVGVEEIVLRD